MSTRTRALSFLLSLIMIFSLLPVDTIALAEKDDGEPDEPVIPLVEGDPAPDGDRDAPVITVLEDGSEDPAEPGLAPLPDEPQDDERPLHHPAGGILP